MTNVSAYNWATTNDFYLQRLLTNTASHIKLNLSKQASKAK